MITYMNIGGLIDEYGDEVSRRVDNDDISNYIGVDVEDLTVDDYFFYAIKFIDGFDYQIEDVSNAEIESYL